MSNNNFSKITSKGQITIPYNIREQLHLNVGSRVKCIIQNNAIVLLPINNKLSDLQGILPKPQKSLTITEMDNLIKKKYDRN